MTTYDELNRDLRSVGRLPRALSLATTLVAALCAWAGWMTEKTTGFLDVIQLNWLIERIR